MWRLLLFPMIVFAQDPLAQDATVMVHSVDNFRRLYNIATRIMELSGSFMNPRNAASGGREFESDNTVTGGAESNSEFSPLRRNTGLLGMPLTSSTSSVAQPRQSAIQGILNTFLNGNNVPLSQKESAVVEWFIVLYSSFLPRGSSVDDSEPLPTPPTPRPRRTNLFGWLGAPSSQQSPQSSTSNIGQINLWELFGVTRPTTTTTVAPLEGILNTQLGNGNTQNIDAILNALMRSNAQPVRSGQSGTTSLLSQFFGKK